jgi:hypothetical protein
MIAITSISPTHINADIQQKAIQSWIDLGMTVYSLNNAHECGLLKDKYPNVEFIETHRTMHQHYGKPLVSISAALDFCKDIKQYHFCLINSDIELRTDKATIDRIKKKMETAIVLCNRVDYDNDYFGNKYLLGIDVFFIHRNFLYIYPQSIHCFGMTFWDYEIPYTAAQSGIEVLFLQQNIAYHKKHAFQYSADHWRKSGRYFIWQHGLDQFNPRTEIGQMSTHVYNFIYNYAKRVEI